MKKVLMMAMVAAIGNVMTGVAVAQGAERTVTVCMAAHVDPVTREAQRVASRIFRNIGIRVEWHDNTLACEKSADGAIIVSYSLHTPKDKVPGGLALAFPRNGRHIEIFYDRILDPQFVTEPGAYLGHVLAHEITHILQGFIRHAKSGVMKASWGQAERARMNNYQFLIFTREDVDLIDAGLARRANISCVRGDEK